MGQLDSCAAMVVMCHPQYDASNGMGDAVHDRVMAALLQKGPTCSTLRFQMSRLAAGSRRDCMRHTASSSPLKRCRWYNALLCFSRPCPEPQSRQAEQASIYALQRPCIAHLELLYLLLQVRCQTAGDYRSRILKRGGGRAEGESGAAHHPFRRPLLPHLLGGLQPLQPRPDGQGEPFGLRVQGL